MSVGQSTLFRPSATPAAGASAEERPKSFHWANIGYSVELTDPETNETSTHFISIPVGIPLDGMKPLKVPAKAGLRKDLISAQNALLEQLQSLFTSNAIPAGENSIIEGLQVQFVHVDSTPAVPSTAIAVPQFGLR